MLQNEVADARRRARRTLSALQAAKDPYGAVVVSSVRTRSTLNLNMAKTCGGAILQMSRV